MSAEQYGAQLLEEVHEEGLDKVSEFLEVQFPAPSFDPLHLPQPLPFPQPRRCS